MPELILVVLKYLFLGLIFVFLLRAVKAMYLEIMGPKALRPEARPAASRAGVRPGRPPDRVTVIPGSGQARTYDIGDEVLIGRDDKCQIVITDSYASSVHARIFRKDDAVFVEDMGSTNGTYLNRRKLSGPAPVSRGDKGRIGKTELEFRK